MQINRDRYLNRLIEDKGNGLIKIVTGMRRCGKTYLLFELFKQHLSANKVVPSHIIEISLNSAVAVTKYECTRCHSLSLQLHTREKMIFGNNTSPSVVFRILWRFQIMKERLYT